jgi:Tol biopolymer transport system component
MKPSLAVSICLAMSVAGFAVGDSSLQSSIDGAPTLAEWHVIRSGSGRVAWSPVVPNQIAFDAPDASDPNGFFDVFVINADGSNEHCLTCSNAALAGRHNMGQPAFHPSGEWLVIQVQQAGTPDGRFTTPGRGVNNELWLISADGTTAWPLPYGDSPPLGVLHPHFSHDGTRLVWAEKYRGWCTIAGCWRLMIADFGFDAGRPRLTNARMIETGQPAGFYETHEFLPGDRELLYTSSAGEGLLSSDIYAVDVYTGVTRALTSIGYNEHAHPSPDGRWITWMTAREVPGTGTEIWIMDSQAQGAARLTQFNDANPFNKGLVPADHEWSPDGRHLALYLQSGTAEDIGDLVILTLH